MRALTIELGGIPVALHLPSLLAGRLRARYRSYLSDRPAEWGIHYRQQPALPRAAPAWIRHEEAVTHFYLKGQRGRLDFSRREARLASSDLNLARPVIERALAYICMQELPRRGDALLLHGVGLVDNGRGMVFFGASGRGKSTVARLARGRATVLSDENVIVRRQGDEVTLVSTPFWGLSTPATEVRQVHAAEVPLVGLFSLHHASCFTLERLAPAAAVMELLTSEKVATERPSSAAAWLAAAERLAAALPLYRLGFQPTTELWRFLREEQVYP